MSRRVVSSPTAHGTLKMSSMNDAQQPTLEQASSYIQDFCLVRLIAQNITCITSRYAVKLNAVLVLTALRHPRLMLKFGVARFAVADVRGAQTPIDSDRNVRRLQGDRIQDPHSVLRQDGMFQ